LKRHVWHEEAERLGAAKDFPQSAQCYASSQRMTLAQRDIQHNFLARDASIPRLR
jgi:hypothetical protein